MSAAEQNELIETLIWSDGDYKFEELVASFELPQLVRVEVGFCTVDERTGLASGQVIMLHCVRKTKKLVCETSLRSSVRKTKKLHCKTPLRNSVLVPLDCPLGVLVQPRANECKHREVSAGQLSSLRAEYSHIKYVFALEGYLNSESLKETLEMGEIFELGDVDTRDCSVKCKNVATGKSVAIKPDINVLFAPLLDCKRHTLAEVKQTFGFPAHVYFMNENSVGVQPTSRCTHSSMSVSMLDAVTVVDEIEQTVVIATTVGNGADNVCLKIPNVLPVRVAVAKGFIPGKEHNRLIVETLKKHFNSMALQSFQNLDMYEDLDAASNTIREMALKQPSSEIQISEFDYGPAPALSPRRVIRQNETSPQLVSGRRQAPPVSTKPKAIIPTPKPTPQPKPKPKPKPAQRKASTMPRIGKLPQTKMSAVDEKHGYVQFNAKAATLNMARKSDSDYDYTFSPPQDTLIEGEHIYERIPYKPMVAPKPLDASVHTVCAPRGGAEARFPTDLSGLGVSQIVELLSELNIACYKEVFERELIDGEMLKSLDEESLKSLGMNSFHVMKLTRFIDGWRPRYT